MADQNRGAYGFRLVRPPHEPELPDLTPIDADAPAVALECRHACGVVDEEEIEEDRVLLREKGNSLLEVRREPLSITLEFPDATTPEALVHPLLTPPISILARWRGDLTLHSGSFFADERAWAVVGEREAGKSTMLASLGARGLPLLADDLLVIDDGVVRAGPACIDLRPDVAERIPGARFLGEVGNRPRYRLVSPAGPSRARLGGFFLLGWSEDRKVRIERLPLAEALRVIYGQEYIALVGLADPEKLMALLGTPMWRVTRPPDWGFTDETIDRILEVTAAAGEG